MRLTARRAATNRYDAVASASSAVVIRAYSTSFGWACRLLAEPEREHVRNVYALVRVADEIVDEPDPTWPADDRGRPRSEERRVGKESSSAWPRGRGTGRNDQTT